MSQAGNASLISINAYRGVTGALFGLAIIAFIARGYIRICINKKVHIEDFILLFAVISLCGTTGLVYTALGGLYDFNQLSLTGHELTFRLLKEIPSISKEEDAASNISWLVIFSVKLAFLFFFRRLISRLQSLKVWWWFATTITIIAGLVSVATSWLTCPHFTVEGLLSSCTGTSTDHRNVRDTTIAAVMDIMGDVLVLSFPVSILWKVRISIRQKIGLAFSLCLSCVMVIVTIVRIAGMRHGGSGNVDVVWLSFWQQQECSIAILMISVSAFRPLFVPSTTRPPMLRHQRSSPSERRRRFLRQRHDPDLYDTNETNKLPQIPSATLTGVASMIGRDRQSTETADLDQQFHSHLPPSDHDRPAEITTTNSSTRDAELGFSTHACSEISNAKQSRSSGTRWWKALLQPKTDRAASTTRTGYWEIMSLFRTGHSESVVQSKNSSEGQV